MSNENWGRPSQEWGEPNKYWQDPANQAGDQDEEAPQEKVESPTTPPVASTPASPTLEPHSEVGGVGPASTPYASPEQTPGSQYDAPGQTPDTPYTPPEQASDTAFTAPEPKPDSGYQAAEPLGTYVPPASDTYDPPQSTGGYQAASTSNGYQAPEPATGYQPPQSTGGYQAPSTSNGYQAPEPATGYQPPSNTGSYPAPPGSGYQPPQGTGGYEAPATASGQQPLSPGGYQQGGIDDPPPVPPMPQDFSQYSGGYQAGGPLYASFGKRVIGWLFDYLIPNIVISIVAGLVGLALGSASDGSGLGETVRQLLGTVLTVVWWFILASISGTTGITPGRKVAKTKLVDAHTGQPVGVGKTFLRYICHIVDTFICFVGWLFPLWDSQRQTLADKIVSTVVIEDIQY